MLGATTAQAYAAWARKNCAQALTDELPEGTKLHWIGPRREDHVILYFHRRCVLILLLFRGALIGKTTGGLYAKVEGMLSRL